ncbi:hypothetical protein MBFIL_09240 [Methanobrevibacter filiformis]|uniref:Transposase IS4-like domain-containing protein n=2 Tax=Methanobrevibacter filiformis TaxID=55758 RepID=A0A166C4K7_9EURY|nr:hypothetical protein MBFIL_09240 [Methanobrevibacter filiformis]
MELVKFFKQIGKIEVTKEAFSQARLKIKPLVFKKLKIHHLSTFYENQTHKKFKGHLLLAADGSKLELPFHKALLKIFGGQKNKFQEIKSCEAKSNMIYDSLNKFILDFELDIHRTSEKTLLQKNLKNLFQYKWLKKMKKIFIFDRGYRSIELYHYLLAVQ